MIYVLPSYANNRFLVFVERMDTMQRLNADKKIFESHKMYHYASDAFFQQSFRPFSTLNNCKKYCLDKNKLYRFKTEFSVLLNVFAVCASKYFHISISDTEIMRNMLHFHSEALEKCDEDMTIMDVANRADKYQNSYSVLVDREYIEIEKVFRGFFPRKAAEFNNSIV